MALVPIRGSFQDWRSMLAHIMEDDEVEKLVIVTQRKDGSLGRAHFEMNRGQLAYAALVISDLAMAEE